MNDKNLLQYMSKLSKSDKQWLIYILNRHKKEKVHCLEFSSHKKAVRAVQNFAWANYSQIALVDDAERLLNKLDDSLYYEYRSSNRNA